MRPAVPTLALAGLLAATVGPPLHAADAPRPTPEQAEFFERKIRPLLAEHCAQCHSADAAKAGKLKAGLTLDSRDALLAGGDSGPAVIPGKPADSLLVQTLRYGGDVKMPPKGKLPDAAVADFEKWVAMGVPDPRDAAAAAPKRQVGMSLEEGRNFWAYKPPVAAPPPAVKDAAWPAGDIDRFILARLEAKGLKPAADADRATLARRLYFALIGLPPSPEETDAFVRDADPAAYEKLVDKLLASPAFGERWGRHWLDVARYAESVTLRGLVFKEGWRYRDYVIDSFNADVPFDRFITEQLAGDLLPAATPADRRRQLVATAFLAMGNTNLEEQDKKQLRMDVVDEQLDVISKGLLGQTVTCARCHDHKFDPIPTRDYYSLAGILRNAKAMEHSNVSKWVEVPLPADPADEATFARHEAEIEALQARIKAAKAKKPSAGGVLAAADVPGVVVDDAQAMKVGEWKASTTGKAYIGAGYVHDENQGKGEKTLTFDPVLPKAGRYEVRLAYSPGPARSNAVPVTVFSAEGEKTIPVDMKQPPPIENRFVSLGLYRFEPKGQSFVIVSNEGTKGHVTADAVAFIPIEDVDAAGGEKPAGNDAAAVAKAGGKGDTLAAMEAELKKLQAAGSRRPMAMSVVEEKAVEETRVHVRGNVHNLGESAPRGFLRVASSGPPPAFPKGQSGRLQLAEWVASKDNPLTARVAANRAWHWLFGSGIVRTPDNFGTTGEAPSHPELLDHLALSFAAEGWSTKKLVRRIVLSRTFRQAAAGDPKGVAADPENRLFGHANRQRLDAECIRDAMLAAGGNLSAERGGPTFPSGLAADYNFKYKGPARRSVYLPVFRNAVPDALEAFDFADPSTVTGRRNASTVAPQALFMMNNPFAVEQAQAAAVRVIGEKHGDDATRVERAYRLALGRGPTTGEKAVAAHFIGGQSGDPKATWATLFQALFASADFRYVD